MSRALFYILSFYLVFSTSAYAQGLQIVEETEDYTEYLFENPEGKVLPPFHVLANYSNGSAEFTILEEVTYRSENVLTDTEIRVLTLSEASKSSY